MMKYEIVRMPTDHEELHELLMEFTPFLDAMYTKPERAIFGEVNFILDHWLFLWDNNAGSFLTVRENGELKMLAMLTQYKDLWHGRMRLDIHRFAVASEELASEQAVLDVVDYLKSVAGLMDFDLLFFCTHDEHGNEIKELIWNKYEKRTEQAENEENEGEQV